MRKIKSFDCTTIYFIIICIVAVAIFALPYLLRIPFIYAFFKNYISVFNSSEYKTTFIELLGAIFGAFLGVTGAIWVQNIANKQASNEQIENNAHLIYDDIKIAMDLIVCIFSEFHEGEIMPELPINGRMTNVFRNQLNIHRFLIIPEWRQTVLSLSRVLEPSELRDLLNIYNDLSQLASAKNLNNNFELSSFYSTMHSYLDKSSLTSHQISIDKKTERLINSIKKIAKI